MQGKRERLGLVTTPTGQKECTKCKSRTHTTDACRSQYCLTCRSWKCNNKFHKKQRASQEREEQTSSESYCCICRETHPFNKHTKSRADGNRLTLSSGHKNHMQSASKCVRCQREVRDSPQTCGACGQVGKPGDTLHCYDHCVEFMQASPDERLRQVLKHDDCTYCLLRDHDTESHQARVTKNPERLILCGITPAGETKSCTSHQNSAFHGAATHKQAGQKQFHLKKIPREAPVTKDSGSSITRGEWERSGQRSRAEEMQEARRLLQQPEVDGDRVLLLIHEVSLITGEDRRQVKSSLFNDKGSTCSMVTKDLVEKLGLESVSKSVVVQSLGHTDCLKTEFVVLEILKNDGTIALVRAYVVDSITNMAKVRIPEHLKEAFSREENWPRERFSGEIGILLGIEELALHPDRLDMVDNLGIFKSPLSPHTILGGQT